MIRIATLSRRFAPALLVSSALAGCAPFTMYRCITTQDRCVSEPPCMAADEGGLESRCASSAVQVLQPASADKPGYVLGFIEFDDQGQLWNRAQMDTVLGAVDPQTSGGADDYLMVVFVHGWKHNAGFEGSSNRFVEDANVVNFRQALTQLSATEMEYSRRVQRPARKVIGVYLGWRGASITTPWIENLTFWDRKNTAHKVGHGQVTEVLQRLELIRQQRILRNADTRSRLIVVGHSFGGAVVFSALEQILESRFTLTEGARGSPAGPVQGFGNLVVLINPAFEAQLYQPLNDMSMQPKKYADNQLPVLAILTSEADLATKVAFPLGRWFSTWFEKQRTVQRRNPVSDSLEQIDQHRADVDAVGHFDPYETHTLKAVPRPAAPATTDVARAAAQNVDALATTTRGWQEDAPGGRIEFPGSLLQRTPNSASRNPYLVIRVDRQLIKDHNDIWRPDIRDFITSLILISSQSKDPGERAHDQEAVKK